MRKSYWSLLGVVAVLAFAGSPLALAGDEGQAAFEAQKCNMCHSVPAAGIEAKVKSEKMKGPDLPANGLEADWIVSYLKHEVQLDGADHKKEFKDVDTELKTIAAWLVSLEKAE